MDDIKLTERHKQLIIRCAVYCGLALVVMLPLLRPGFILTLDMVFAPKITIPESANGTQYIFWGILHVLNFVLSSGAIQKIILFGILFLSGFGMHRFLQKIGPKSLVNGWQWGCYFGGTLFMINPFAYSRFMAGQFTVLLGYALIPFFATAFIRFCSRPSRRTAAWLVAWVSLTAIISLHTLGILAIIAVAISCMTALKVYKVIPWRKAFIKWGLAALAVIVVINSYWLIPALLGKGTTAEIVSSFSSSDQQAFATDPGKLGLFGNVLALQGFWGESKNLFLVPADTQSWWLMPIILLWSLVLFGIYTSYKSRRSVSITLLAIIIIGACLAIGTAGTFVAPFNEFLVRHVPFFAGYREPQKFVALIVFGYSYFGAVAIARIAVWLQQHKYEQYVSSAMIVLLLVPLLCSSLMVWGFRGQLRAADYPVQWYAMRDMLGGSCKDDCKVLFLPWHLYMRYDFAGRIVANPSQKFFGNQIVASNDPELKGAAAYRTSEDQRVIGGTILPTAEQGDKNMAAELKKLHIKFILLAKENDYKRYDYLEDQANIKLVHDFPTIKLYEVK
jgi:hypothetical protein